MKKTIKHLVLLSIPFILAGTIAIGTASWKDSTIDSSGVAQQQNLYTIYLRRRVGNATALSMYRQYEGLEYTSYIELPNLMNPSFTGWKSTTNVSKNPGCYKVQDFSPTSYTLIIDAQYSS